MRRSMLSVCVLSVALAGCGKNEFVGRPDLEFQAGGEMPPPARVDLAAPAGIYVIGPSDQLSINVFGIEELTRDVTVDHAGNISLPLTGSIQASGNTPEELAVHIRERLQASHVRDPRVAVNIAEPANRVFTVAGAVGRPGSYPLPGRTSLMRAIAQAAGTTEFSDENYVVVFRQVNNRQHATLYDLRAIRAGMYPDPEIFTNDLVVVGESRARRVFKDALATVPLLTIPLIRVLD